MFVLVSLKDTFRIHPQDLNRPHLQSVTGEIRKTYYDKVVVPEHGLCISLYDIQSVEGGFVFPGDGAPRFTVKFRMVMFRPFVGEVLVGKLTGCDPTGLYVSVGFFGDIYIPEHLLQAPSTFDEEERLWVWKFNENDMFMDLDEQVRFRVAQVKYPALPLEQEQQDKSTKPFAPMQITGDINADGLGLVQWWS
eukprot:jgi/Mesen1/4913/ME000246S04147